MLTPEALLDVHERAHRNLIDYLKHCRTLTTEAFDRAMPEFAGASVRLQLHHAIDVEMYWIGVLQGRVDADENAHLLSDDRISRGVPGDGIRHNGGIPAEHLHRGAE